MTPELDFFRSTTEYNVAFTLHGSLMVFFFIVPGIAASFGNFLIPLMIGARDVAFPRINLVSFWIYLVGTAILLFALLQPADTGWTFYTPYSIQTGAKVILITLGVFVLGFSSILTGMNFIVTITQAAGAGNDVGAASAVHLGVLRDGHTAAAGHSRGGNHASAAHSREGSRHRLFRPGQGRRPHTVPELLLVLLPPGRLHNGHTGLRNHLGDNPRFRQKAHIRIQGHSLLELRHSHNKLLRLAAPHVRERNIGDSRGDILLPDDAGGDTDGDKGV